MGSFTEIFIKWEDNVCLNLKDLRLKTLTLLARSLMLRPSHVAPKSISFVPISNRCIDQVFSRDLVVFNQNGGAVLLCSA